MSRHPSRRTAAVGPLLALLAANAGRARRVRWPLVATAAARRRRRPRFPSSPLALLPLAALVVLGALDGTVRSAHTLALLGTLAAIGAAIRIVGTGVGGVEAVFILLILAGRAFGARFGLLLGMLTIALSSVVWGGIGPWTPVPDVRVRWVGAGAGLLPRRASRVAEIGDAVRLRRRRVVRVRAHHEPVVLALRGRHRHGHLVRARRADRRRTSRASWCTRSSRRPLTWDTLRAITTVDRHPRGGSRDPERAAPGEAGHRAAGLPRRPGPQVRPRSTSPRGGGTRTRPSTARDAAAAPR